jgi:glycerophosphoryl diester phosphodiesterase
MLILGHQGDLHRHPGNSLEAFRAALEEGADGVELDVRRTRDGSLALRHDAELPDGRPLVEAIRADLPHEVPVLGDGLDALAGSQLVNIEIKNSPWDADFDETAALADAVADLLRSRAGQGDPAFVVSCFHLETVDRFHAVAPEVPTGWLVYDAADHRPLLEQTVAHGHEAFHPNQGFVTEALVADAHALGLTVNTWTCDDPERLRWFASIGVDAVIVNDPIGALAAVGRAPG